VEEAEAEVKDQIEQINETAHESWADAIDTLRAECDRLQSAAEAIDAVKTETREEMQAAIDVIFDRYKPRIKAILPQLEPISRIAQNAQLRTPGEPSATRRQGRTSWRTGQNRRLTILLTIPYTDPDDTTSSRWTVTACIKAKQPISRSKKAGQ
jgi:hypothetical protein